MNSSNSASVGVSMRDNGCSALNEGEWLGGKGGGGWDSCRDLLRCSSCGGHVLWAGPLFLAAPSPVSR